MLDHAERCYDRIRNASGSSCLAMESFNSVEDADQDGEARVLSRKRFSLWVAVSGCIEYRIVCDGIGQLV